jgi:diguanylate cyclase (GGDEF)-like protein
VVLPAFKSILFISFTKVYKPLLLDEFSRINVMKASASCKERVLFADDSKTARAAARKVLQNSFDVIDASNGDEAWLQLENNASIKLVVADINMPDSNGFELLNKIRQSKNSRISRLPVIVITGIENSAAAMRAALKLGATDFISKPFKGFDLMCRVRSYIALNEKIDTLEAELKNKKAFDRFQLDQHEFYARKCLSFANRHKSTCSFACVDIDVLSDINSQYDNNILMKIQKLIGKRVSGHLRGEDFFSQIAAHRFGLVMPATSQLKAQILLVRLIDVLNSMSLEISGKSYRLSAKSGVYTRAGLQDTDSYEDLMDQLDDAVNRCKKNNNNNKIAICGDKRTEEAISIADEAVLAESLSHIISGEYHKIVDGHVAALSNKLGPFIQYANGFSK